MGFKFALVSTDGDVFDSFESAVPHWSAGDTVIAAGNRPLEGRFGDPGRVGRGVRRRAAERRARGRAALGITTPRTGDRLRGEREGGSTGTRPPTCCGTEASRRWRGP